MARAALQWSLHDLAAAASVSRVSCARFEGGENVGDKTVEAMRSALERAGADFTAGRGRVGVSVPKEA